MKGTMFSTSYARLASHFFKISFSHYVGFNLYEVA